MTAMIFRLFPTYVAVPSSKLNDGPFDKPVDLPQNGPLFEAVQFLCLNAYPNSIRIKWATKYNKDAPFALEVSTRPKNGHKWGPNIELDDGMASTLISCLSACLIQNFARVLEGQILAYFNVKTAHDDLNVRHLKAKRIS